MTFARVDGVHGYSAAVKTFCEFTRYYCMFIVQVLEDTRKQLLANFCDIFEVLTLLCSRHDCLIIHGWFVSLCSMSS